MNSLSQSNNETSSSITCNRPVLPSIFVNVTRARSFNALITTRIGTSSHKVGKRVICQFKCRRRCFYAFFRARFLISKAAAEKNFRYCCCCGKDKKFWMEGGGDFQTETLQIIILILILLLLHARIISLSRAARLKNYKNFFFLLYPPPPVNRGSLWLWWSTSLLSLAVNRLHTLKIYFIEKPSPISPLRLHSQKYNGVSPKKDDAEKGYEIRIWIWPANATRPPGNILKAKFESIWRSSRYFCDGGISTKAHFLLS